MRKLACLLAIAVAALFAAGSNSQRLYAGHPCCVLCGCEPCEKVCRMVWEEKKITVTCLGFKDEDFCVPGRSECIDKNCEMVCDEASDPEKLCSQPKPMVWFDWRPKTDPTIYTKRKLMRKTVTKKVPTYRWVVQDLCKECQVKHEAQPTPAAESKPPAPKPAESKPPKDDLKAAKPTATRGQMKRVDKS